MTTAVASDDRRTTPSGDRVFVAADWSQLETWLTAHFADDKIMRGELEAQLRGGPKIHAINAALLFGCTPETAHEMLVDFQGRRIPAYQAGKRCTHAFSYGMQAKKLASTYWLPTDLAEAVIARLSAKYHAVVAWRQRLCNEVFGQAEYVCDRCGYSQTAGPGDCPHCSTPKWPKPLRFANWIVEPSRIHRTPFGRRRIYLGTRTEGANALASQDPQSCGASMWYRTLLRLHGYDPATNGSWPTPDGALRWDPARDPYSALRQPAPITVATGTYDSFVLEAPRERSREVLEWLLWTMEQPWPELGGLRVPAEGAIGSNWGKQHVHSDRCEPRCPFPSNPDGLVAVERGPFESKWTGP